MRKIDQLINESNQQLQSIGQQLQNMIQQRNQLNQQIEQGTQQYNAQHARLQTLNEMAAAGQDLFENQPDQAPEDEKTK